MISLDLALKYFCRFGIHSYESVYETYPYCKNVRMDFLEMIERLNKELKCVEKKVDVGDLRKLRELYQKHSNRPLDANA